MNGPIHELPQCKVVQDLDKLMSSLTTKISTIYDMKEVLEAPDNPPPQQRYELCPVAINQNKKIVGVHPRTLPFTSSYI